MPTRRDFKVAALTALAVLAASYTFVAHAAPPVAPAPAGAAAPAIMRSPIFDSPNIMPEQTKTGERREVFDAPTATLARLASLVPPRPAQGQQPE